MSGSNADRVLAGAQARAPSLAVPELGAQPQLGLAVLTCMDARIDPLAMLDLRRGDAHVIRNAGGLASDDAVRSLSVSQHLLGTREVIVVMHEGCGLLGADDERFAATLAAQGADPQWRLGAFADLDEAVRASLRRLREAPELPARDRIRGFVFDPFAGSLREVLS
jgi:carbonic anhydrase